VIAKAEMLKSCSQQETVSSTEGDFSPRRSSGPHPGSGWIHGLHGSRPRSARTPDDIAGLANFTCAITNAPARKWRISLGGTIAAIPCFTLGHAAQW
jgi:hypothetical protein